MVAGDASGTQDKDVTMPMSEVVHVTHILRYVDALANGDAVNLASFEEAEAVAAAFDVAHPDSPCAIEPVGLKWLVYRP